MERDVCLGEHWINSTKLLKPAKLYPVYCTVVLMALVVLGSLLIKKEQKGHKRVVLLPEQNDPKKGPFTP